MKVIEKCPEKSFLRREVSGVESDSREWEVHDTLRLYSGGDVLGAPVPHCLHQQHRGGGESRHHQDRPDDPRGPRLGEVDVGQAVYAGGGEKMVDLQPGVFNIFPGHCSLLSQVDNYNGEIIFESRVFDM